MGAARPPASAALAGRPHTGSRTPTRRGQDGTPARAPGLAAAGRGAGVARPGRVPGDPGAAAVDQGPEPAGRRRTAPGRLDAVGRGRGRPVLPTRRRRAAAQHPGAEAGPGRQAVQHRCDRVGMPSTGRGRAHVHPTTPRTGTPATGLPRLPAFLRRRRCPRARGRLADPGPSTAGLQRFHQVDHLRRLGLFGIGVTSPWIFFWIVPRSAARYSSWNSLA